MEKEKNNEMKNNTDKELERFDSALNEAKNQLKTLFNKAVNEVGEDNAMIFEIHRMMLEDDDYINSIHSHIFSSFHLSKRPE